MNWIKFCERHRERERESAFLKWSMHKPMCLHSHDSRDIVDCVFFRLQCCSSGVSAAVSFYFCLFHPFAPSFVVAVLVVSMVNETLYQDIFQIDILHLIKSALNAWAFKINRATENWMARSKIVAFWLIWLKMAFNRWMCSIPLLLFRVTLFFSLLKLIVCVARCCCCGWCYCLNRFSMYSYRFIKWFCWNLYRKPHRFYYEWGRKREREREIRIFGNSI